MADFEEFRNRKNDNAILYTASQIYVNARDAKL